MKDNIVKRVITVFLVMVSILVVVTVVTVRNIRHSIATGDWVNHTHAVIMEADAILSSVHAGNAALHAYLLTGDARDQTSCREAYAEMVEHLEVAKALTLNEPPQNQMITQLEPLLSKCVELTQTAIKARQESGPEAIRKVLEGDAAGRTIREVQRSVEKLKGEEKRLLQERDMASFLQAQTTRWTVLAGVGFNLMLVFFAAWLVRDDIAARKQAANALQAANEQLERKVAERTAELAGANRSLKAENLERRWTIQSMEHQIHYAQLIINCIDDLILVLTKAQNISRINPAVEYLTGLESPELISQPLSRILIFSDQGPSAATPKYELIARALKEGRDLKDLRAFVVNKEGQRIPVQFNLFPMRDGDKVVAGVVTLKQVATQALERA